MKSLILFRTAPLIACCLAPLNGSAREHIVPLVPSKAPGMESPKQSDTAVKPAPGKDFLSALEGLYANRKAEVDAAEKALRAKSAVAVPVLFRKEKGNHSGLLQIFPLGSYDYDRLTGSRRISVTPLLGGYERQYNTQGQMVFRHADVLLTGRMTRMSVAKGGDTDVFYALPLLTLFGGETHGKERSRFFASLPLASFWLKAHEDDGKSMGVFASLPLLTMWINNQGVDKNGESFTYFTFLPLGSWSHTEKEREVNLGPWGILGSFEKSDQKKVTSVGWSLLYEGVSDPQNGYFSQRVTPFVRYERSNGEKALRLFHFLRIPLGASQAQKSVENARGKQPAKG